MDRSKRETVREEGSEGGKQGEKRRLRGRQGGVNGRRNMSAGPKGSTVRGLRR